MPQLTYLEAIRQGIWEEMERDPSVFCIGEDIGIYGGAFKITDGFIDRFGPERVIDTPIAESAIVGAAFGASLTGMRPVAEFQFMDFIGCAFNQISNMVAKTHYLWGAPAPLVLRGPSGGMQPSEYVRSLRPEPGVPPDPVVTLVGLLGESDRAGYQRLYFDRSLTYFAEFRTDDVTSMEAVGPDSPPFVGIEAARATLRDGAVVDAPAGANCRRFRADDGPARARARFRRVRGAAAPVSGGAGGAHGPQCDAALSCSIGCGSRALVRSSAARTNSRKSGAGRSGRDLNSG